MVIVIQLHCQLIFQILMANLIPCPDYELWPVTQNLINNFNFDIFIKVKLFIFKNNQNTLFEQNLSANDRKSVLGKIFGPTLVSN